MQHVIAGEVFRSLSDSCDICLYLGNTATQHNTPSLSLMKASNTTYRLLLPSKSTATVVVTASVVLTPLEQWYRPDARESLQEGDQAKACPGIGTRPSKNGKTSGNGLG